MIMKIKISTIMNNNNKPIAIYSSNKTVTILPQEVITAITTIMTKMIFSMSFLINHPTAQDNNLQIIKTTLIIVQGTILNLILAIF